MALNGINDRANYLNEVTYSNDPAAGLTAQTYTNPGFETGPFQTWQKQPDASEGGRGGFYSAFDQTQTQIFTELIPEVVFGGWQEYYTPYNVVVYNRGNLYEDEVVQHSYTLTKPLEFQGRTNKKVTVYLDHVLKLAIAFQDFELNSVGANQMAFEYEQAIKGLARVFELETVKDLYDQGKTRQDLVKYAKDPVTGEVVFDVYNTFLAVRKCLAEQGNMQQNVDVFTTPDVVNQIMNDRHYISNGQCETHAFEVRNGFMGRILGFNIYESGRLNWMNESGALGARHANLFFVDRTQVILNRMVVKPISLVPAPSDRPGVIFMTALEYFKHYIINDYSVINMDTTLSSSFLPAISVSADSLSLTATEGEASGTITLVPNPTAATFKSKSCIVKAGSEPTKGTARTSGLTVMYTANAGATGTDTFDVIATWMNEDRSTVSTTVTVTVSL